MYQRAWFVVLVSVLFTARGMAQTTATISGSVRDSTGALIPGASVTAKNVETGITRTTSTDEQGRYQLLNLSVGGYEIEVSLSGFQTAVRSGIVLAVGEQTVVNFTLQVGRVSEKVEVTEQAPLVDTTTSAVGGVVETSQIVNLPLNGRSFDELAQLQPGVTVAKFAGAGSIQSGYTTKISIRGARPEQNSFLLDGTDVMGPTNQIPGSVGGQSFGVDAVREFRVETTTYSAQYGRAAGGVINVVTKSGTNELHGTAFEFLRNDNLDAATWDDNRAGHDKPEFKRNQFGFSLGGPVATDRTFFFGSYEGRRDRQGRTATSLVPTAAIRTTAIPAVRPFVDAFWPLPNGPVVDASKGIAEYNYTASSSADEDYFTVRMDHRFSNKDSIFSRYTFDDGRNRTPATTGVFWTRDKSRNQFVTLETTHIFSPALLNSLRGGFNRSFTAGFPFLVGVDESTLSKLPNLMPGRPVLVSGGSLNPGDIDSVGNDNLPRVWSWNLGEVSDDVTYARGLHSLKFGALFKQMLYIQQQSNASGGTYDFGSLAEFLAGTPSAFRARQNTAVNGNGFTYQYLGWYIQDDWRVIPRLTLNLGLRHEFYTGPSERHGLSCNLDHLSDPNLRCGGQVFPTSITTKDFGPRAGFAWDVFGNAQTSLRGGFGIFYDAISPLWWQGPAVGSYPPFGDAQIDGTSAAGVAALASAPFPNSFRLVGQGASQTSYLAAARFTGAPSTMQYNLTIQQQISSDSTIMLGYVGSLGRHLWLRANENTRPPTILSDGRKCFNYNTDQRGRATPIIPGHLGSNPSCPDGPLERKNPLYGDVRVVRTEANSTYNGFVAAFQKRFGRGLQFQTSYTLSKSMDTGSTITNATNSGGSGGTGLLDPEDWVRDRSLSDFDTRHIFSQNFTWELPVGPGKALGSGLTGVAAQVLGGWEISGIFKAASGSPITINSSSAGWSETGNTNRLERPDLVPGANNNPVHGVSRGCAGFPAGTKLGTPDLWFDPCAFTVSPLGFFGNLGRNTVIGPDRVTLDYSLVKNTAIPRISEQFRVQFRAEFFNIANHPNFGLPSLRLVDNRGNYDLRAGVITTTAIGTTARQIQFGFKFLW
jgi:hypothetical protein